MSELFCDNLNKQGVDLNLSEDLWSLNALVTLKCVLIKVGNYFETALK